MANTILNPSIHPISWFMYKNQVCSVNESVCRRITHLQAFIISIIMMFTDTLLIVSWEPERRYQYSKMFRWEPEGRYRHRHCTAIAPFWFSTECLWILIAPFWLSTDDFVLSVADSSGGYNRCTFTPNISAPRGLSLGIRPMSLKLLGTPHAPRDNYRGWHCVYTFIF